MKTNIGVFQRNIYRLLMIVQVLVFFFFKYSRTSMARTPLEP